MTTEPTTLSAAAQAECDAIKNRWLKEHPAGTMQQWRASAERAQIAQIIEREIINPKQTHEHR